MSDATVSLIVKIIFGLALFGFLLSLRKKDKETKAKIQNIYPEFERKYRMREDEIYKKSLELNPSKHLIDNEERWFEIINKQAEYQRQEENKLNEEFKKEYNLIDKEWNLLIQIYNEKGLIRTKDLRDKMGMVAKELKGRSLEELKKQDPDAHERIKKLLDQIKQTPMGEP